MKTQILSSILVLLTLSCSSSTGENKVADEMTETIAQTGGSISVKDFDQKMKAPGVQILGKISHCFVQLPSLLG